MPDWVLVAVAAGFGAAASAILLSMWPAPDRAPTLRPTATWRLDELDRPTVVCTDFAVAPAPPGVRVLASGRVAGAVLRAGTVQRVAEPAAEFAIDAAGGRALLFFGGVRPGAWALPTSDPVLLARLRAEVDRLVAAATPYAERRRVADLAGEPGLPVEAEGVVRAVLPQKEGGALLRLEDEGNVAAVHVAAADPALAGRRVLVRGRLARDASGYAVVEADEVKPVA